MGVRGEKGTLLLHLHFNLHTVCQAMSYERHSQLSGQPAVVQTSDEAVSSHAGSFADARWCNSTDLTGFTMT